MADSRCMSDTDIVSEVTKHPGGRPSEYDPKFVDLVDTYLALATDTIVVVAGSGFRTEVKLPKREGFAKFLGYPRQTLDNWAKEHPEFFDALERIDAEQRERLIDKGLSGDYNPTIAKLILSANHGMAEKSESKNEHSGNVSFNLTDLLHKANG